MNVLVNGESRRVEDGATIEDLLRSLEVSVSAVAVEVNERLVPKAQFGDQKLEPSDQIEIVTLVGGG